MLEWLKELLEQAKIEDGKLDVETLMESVRKTFPEHAVPKTEFNDLNGKLKDANKTLADLKKSNEGNEALQGTIKDYEAKIKDLEAKSIQREKEIAVISALKEAGAIDPDYIVFKLGGWEKVEVDTDGNVKDVDKLVKSSKEQYPIAFKSEDPKATDPKDPTKTPLQRVAEKTLNTGTGNTDKPVNSLADALSEHYVKK